jgi:hypothetical protein
MNKHENNKVSMYQSVNAVLECHGEAVDGLAPLKAAVDKYRESITTLQKRDSVYTATTAGITAAKKNAVEELADKALVCAKALHAMSVASGNEQLKVETKITRSKMIRGRISSLQQRAVRIIFLTEEHADALTEYGIDAAIVADLKAALEYLESTTGEQARKIAEHKAARTQLTGAFDVTNHILKDELDSLMLVVKEKNADFYDQYKAARVIRDLGGSHSVKQPATVREQDAEKEVKTAA